MPSGVSGEKLTELLRRIKTQPEVAVDQIKLYNFADFFFISNRKDLDEIKEELFEAGISTDENQDKILNYFRQQRAEILLETGRRFKEKYLKLKAESTIKNSTDDFARSGLALAYRKKSGNSDNAEDEDSFLLELIKKAKENEKSKQ